MNARPPTDLARHAILTIRGVRHASAAPQPRTIPPESYGKQIFVYNHLQKNHVVYSLTKGLKNHKSLSQLPYNGKKTVPRALRKDLWTPLATLTFPSGPTGLSVYQKLRELRRRHELEWTQKSLFPDEEYDPEKKEEDEKHKGLSKKQIEKVAKHELMKKRARALCDQRANSVADMAFVLGRLESEEAAKKVRDVAAEERRKKAESEAEALAEKRKENGMSEERITNEKTQTEEKRMEEERRIEELEANSWGQLGLIGEGTGVEVLVEWRNLVDAEYAQTWSGNVVHGVLETTVNNRKGKSRIQEIIEEPVAEVETEGVKEKEKIAA